MRLMLGLFICFDYEQDSELQKNEHICFIIPDDDTSFSVQAELLELLMDRFLIRSELSFRTTQPSTIASRLAPIV